MIVGVLGWLIDDIGGANDFFFSVKFLGWVIHWFAYLFMRWLLRSCKKVASDTLQILGFYDLFPSFWGFAFQSGNICWIAQSVLDSIRAWTGPLFLVFVTMILFFPRLIWLSLVTVSLGTYDLDGHMSDSLHLFYHQILAKNFFSLARHNFTSVTLLSEQIGPFFSYVCISAYKMFHFFIFSFFFLFFGW